MDFTESLGLLAGFFITLSFIPQIIRVIRLKSAREISILFTVIQMLGLACWLAYGIILELLPVIATNVALTILVVTLLGAKLKYGRQS